MAREARLALADMRASQTQMRREEMHGGAFHGAGLVGGGGVPSMGLSQFRGGAMRGCGKRCKGCEMCCDESSSDEEDMRGGSWYSAAARALGLGAKVGSTVARPGSVLANLARPSAALVKPTSTALALRPAGTMVKYGVNNANANIASRLAYLNSPASRALALRTPGTIKPYNPAEAAYRLGSTTTARTIASRLAAAGITPARVAAALAAGVALTGLLGYFGVFDDDSGYYDETPGTGPITVRPPIGPGGPGGPGGTGPGTGGTGGIGPDGEPLPGMTAEEEDFYLRTGNIPYRFLEGSLGRKRGSGLVAFQSQMSPNSFLNRMPSRKTPMMTVRATRRVGSGRPMGQAPPERTPYVLKKVASKIFEGVKDGRQARAAIVKKVMQEQGLSLPMASKYVKDNGLY